jgi:hypothetical protein
VKLELNDIVSWTSQAQGSTKHKVGVIVEIVPPSCLPSMASTCDPRGHESYVVLVKPLRGNAKPKKYWPRVAALVKEA